MIGRVFIGIIAMKLALSLSTSMLSLILAPIIYFHLFYNLIALVDSISVIVHRQI